MSDKDKNDLKFARKIYIAIQLLGGQSDILGTVSGWRDHLLDSEVFESLDSWISTMIEEQSAALKEVKRLNKNTQQ